MELGSMWAVYGLFQLAFSESVSNVLVPPGLS